MGGVCANADAAVGVAAGAGADAAVGVAVEAGQCSGVPHTCSVVSVEPNLTTGSDPVNRSSLSMVEGPTGADPSSNTTLPRHALSKDNVNTAAAAEGGESGLDGEVVEEGEEEEEEEEEGEEEEEEEEAEEEEVVRGNELASTSDSRKSM